MKETPVNEQLQGRPQKKHTSAGHKLLTVVGIVLCVILIPILVINCTLIVKSFTDQDEVPSIGGYLPLIILSDSMYPEFESGDLIICHTLEPQEVQIGDVIAFFDPAGNGTSIVSHRVMEIIEEDDGLISWRTKGDANNVQDAMTVPQSKLVGVYRRTIPGVGNIAMFMQSTAGLILCVLVPILLLVAYDIIRRRVYESRRREDTQALREELEALRQEKAAQASGSESEQKAPAALADEAGSKGEADAKTQQEQSSEATASDSAEPEAEAAKEEVEPEAEAAAGESAKPKEEQKPASEQKAPAALADEAGSKGEADAKTQQEQSSEATASDSAEPEAEAAKEEVEPEAEAAD